ncbi:MAG TPA: hypothetical protein VGJ97_09470 [Anaerolineaceae bacterium]|jgi:hypothetical protein
MSAEPNFDILEAHRYFSAECFNQAWQLVVLPNRTTEDTEEMIHLSLASLWHWTQRPDCTPTNLAVGFWLVSRVYALAGQAENARYYGKLSLEASQAAGVHPFYQTYAFEALARAAAVAGNQADLLEYLEKARASLSALDDPQTREHVLKDLAKIADI